MNVLPPHVGNLYGALTSFVENDPKMQGLMRHFEGVKREMDQKATSVRMEEAAQTKADAAPSAGHTQAAVNQGDMEQTLAHFTKPEDFTSAKERDRKEREKKKRGAPEGDAKKGKKTKDKKLPHEKPAKDAAGGSTSMFLQNIGWMVCMTICTHS